jgi:hypothetical protein
MALRIPNSKNALRLLIKLPLALTIATGLAALGAGCATGGIGQYPLRPGQIARLSDAAVPAGDMGLGWNRNGRPYRLAALDGESSGIVAEIEIFDDGSEELRHLLAKVSINGVDGLALIDTGSPVSLLSYRFARKARIRALTKGGSPDENGKTLQKTTIYGLGGRSSQIAAVAEKLRLGSLELERIPLQILDSRRGFGGMKWIGISRIDMILGNDILALFDTVAFDFKRKRITLRSYGQDEDRPPPASESIALYSVRPLPIAAGRIADSPPLPIVIDSGSDGGLWVPRKLHSRLDLLDHGAADSEGRGRGLGGRTVVRQIAPHAIVFDNLTVRNVPVTIELASQSQREAPFALLGLEVLRRFRVEIDYSRARLMLERVDETPL